MCRRSYAHHALFPTVAVLSSEEPSYPRSFPRLCFCCFLDGLLGCMAVLLAAAFLRVVWSALVPVCVGFLAFLVTRVFVVAEGMSAVSRFFIPLRGCVSIFLSVCFSCLWLSGVAVDGDVCRCGEALCSVHRVPVLLRCRQWYSHRFALCVVR